MRVNNFYGLMRNIRDAKRSAVAAILAGEKPADSQIDFMKGALADLENMGKKGLKLSYEIGEMKKDIIYLEDGKGALVRYFSRIHKDFNRQAEIAFNALKGREFTALITDRDGTINNYCERYNTSVQSVYNSVFVSDFASRKTESTVILSSAPLGSLLEVVTIPKSVQKRKIVYAGSRGAEFMSSRGTKKYPIPPREKRSLKKLAAEIERLLRTRGYRKFSSIGSGFQRKYGHLTVARQDISGSIGRKESKAFLGKIEAMAGETGNRFAVRDTGLDIEISPVLNRKKDFGKDDGINYIARTLGISFERAIVCGDTESDLEMLAAARKMGRNTQAIFVTKDKKLMAEARKIIPNTIIVSNPDILVTVLERLAEGS